jgi:segregation and condensation protein A
VNEAKPDAILVENAVSSHPLCAVKVPVFEGPLDLLLHLIRINEVDIEDIPIALISEQYLEYLELMRMLDIDVAAEYLLMAATLAHIKSRMLLPPDPSAEEGDADADPRAELARRLAEYAVFKEAAEHLDQIPRLGRDVFTGEVDGSELPQREAALSVSLVALMDAMRSVLEQLPEEQRHHRIARDSITAQGRMIAVMDSLRGTPGAMVLFEDLLLDGEPTRPRVLMTFLAILELARIQAIRIFQNVSPEGRPFGPIRVRLAVESWGEGDRAGHEASEEEDGGDGV